ncbi:MAG: rod shape-determining protein MreD [Actinobacteria bacterium]|jgi:rod shape-determining protein MreD|nr:rod shape-determining protein MreD [Actinomycetota bacterium]
MNWRAVAIAAFILVAALLQVGVATQLGLPLVAPDVMLVAVIAVALRRGGTIGAIVGVAAGLLSDLLPPSASLLGVSAIAFGVVGGVTGWLASRDKKRNQFNYWRAVGFTVIAAIAALLINTGVVAVFDSERLVTNNFVLSLLWQGAYALVLAAVLVPIYAWIDRVTAPVNVVTRR